MLTEVCTIDTGPGYDEALQRALEELRNGRLVVIPTETVYGLAANALHPEGMDRLRSAKSRHADHPFTVHIGRPRDAFRYLTDVKPFAERLMRKGWPGPLTMVFPVSDPTETEFVRSCPGEFPQSLYHDGSIGLRCPDHEFTRDLLTRAEFPVVAASANSASKTAPSVADGIGSDLDGQVELIVDDGRCRYAKSSTVVRIQEKNFRILREGTIDERMLKDRACLNILLVCTGNTCRSPMAEIMCREALSKKLGIPVDMLEEAGYRVRSVGMHGVDGASASSGAVQAMKERGLDLSSHVSRSIDIGMVRQADHIWTMCQHHAEGVLQMVPTVRDRVERIGGDRDIEDPIGQPQGRYDECAQDLADALRRRFEEIEL